MAWLTLNSKEWRGPRAKAKELQRAYQAVFTSPDGQIVLADLAANSGFYFASDANLTERQAGYGDGRKAVYARILGMLRLTEREREDLEIGFREEVISQQEDQ